MKKFMVLAGLLFCSQGMAEDLTVSANVSLKHFSKGSITFSFTTTENIPETCKKAMEKGSAVSFKPSYNFLKSAEKKVILFL